MYCVRLADERARPVVEHVGDRLVVGDAEREIQVGEAVAGVNRERADGRSGDHALVLPGEPQQLLAESVPLVDREHAPRVYCSPGARRADAAGASGLTG